MNFHRANLLTDSDRRKYKELFARMIANEVTSLPVLSSVQKKTKITKGLSSINMPSNLLPTNFIEAESTSSNSNENSTDLSTGIWMNVQYISKQLPIISSKNDKKVQLAKKVTNVIQRNNIQPAVDKII